MPSARPEQRAFPNHPLDAQDMARTLTGFRGQPITRTPSIGGTVAAATSGVSAYVFDEESAMVYIVV